MAYPDLHSIQRLFSEALFDPSDKRITAYLTAPANADVVRRFDVYRNNVFYSLTAALADLYPVVQRLVGEEFFRATATEFLRCEPVRQAAMVHFGAAFPGFLEEFEHTRRQPWLAEVARLELGRHRALHAADDQALAIEAFTRIEPEVLPTCLLILHPSMHLFESSFPVLRIWETNQPDAIVEQVDLDSGGEAFWILRSGMNLMMHREPLADIHFLRALQEGATLGQAAESAMAIDPGFTPTAIFSTAIANGFFIDIRE